MDSVSDNVAVVILQCLSPDERLNLALVSKAWNMSVETPAVWKSLLLPFLGWASERARDGECVVRLSVK